MHSKKELCFDQDDIVVTYGKEGGGRPFRSGVYRRGGRIQFQDQNNRETQKGGIMGVFVKGNRKTKKFGRGRAASGAERLGKERCSDGNLDSGVA